MVRKPEKGTGPKVFYLGADESAIRPEVAARPLIFKEGQVHLRPLGAPMPDPERPGRPARRLRRAAREAVGHRHGPLSALQGISTGAMLLSALLWCWAIDGPLAAIAGPALSIVFIALTAVVLVIDLERPERFYYILTRPNWRRGWCGARGSSPRTARSARLWLAAGWFGMDSAT